MQSFSRGLLSGYHVQDWDWCDYPCGPSLGGVLQSVRMQAEGCDSVQVSVLLLHIDP